jgi:hypothetical protein
VAGLSSCFNVITTFLLFSEHTLQQVFQGAQFTLDHHNRPVPHFGPECIHLEPSGSTEPNVIQRPSNPIDDTGIHLGSTYALSLGFSPPKYDINKSTDMCVVTDDAL